MSVKIIIRDLEKPAEKNLDKDIQWLCESLGFYEKIDREKTAAAIFKALLQSQTLQKELNSTTIGSESKVTRGAALNHLHRMINAGLVVKKGTRYAVRCSNLHATITELHRDIDQIFQDMEDIAKEIDDRMGIKRRE
jgi:predicted transcriptional regulator